MIKDKNKSTTATSLLRLWLIGVGILLNSNFASAQQFCFAMATSYYEQVYCEVTSKGAGKQLPSFYQFKKNNPMTQALLLKRPAANIGIDLKMPKATSTAKPKLAVAVAKPDKARPKSAPAYAEQSTVEPIAEGCALVAEQISCPDGIYQLQGNKRNSRLQASALSADNRLALPRFTGNNQDLVAVKSYLLDAYAHYLRKMQFIGLAASITSFEKFSYLYFDLLEKSADFVDRFETMYHYLKKDKASIAVSEKISTDTELQLGDCAPLANEFWLCQRGNKNHLFARINR